MPSQPFDTPAHPSPVGGAGLPTASLPEPWLDSAALFGPVEEGTRYRPDGDPAQIFGPRATLNPALDARTEIRPAAASDPANQAALQGMLFVVFAMFAVLVYQFRGFVPGLFSMAVNGSRMNSAAQDRSILFRIFIGTANGMGILALTAALTALYLESGTGDPFPEPFRFFNRAVALVIVAAIASICLYRYLLHRLIVWVAGSRDLIRELSNLNKIVFAVASVIGVPLLLIFGFRYQTGENTVAWFLAIFLSFFLLYYLIETFRFFVVRKISLLQWFLYLCAVEFLPVSWFVLLAVR
jgi:hypothetical protein